ncbi:ribonuclease D [Porticoccus sp. W117]|uniref:ribonuclease D n=1 Tax=Porticoccus sp. W117 TaxID=3054777 RepID=UPI00259ADAB8|nr:ribonuclease D [Porticoccus sp. W117]MDM3871155.1 ribonuclease D [Porticoccus sp. W117]
MTDILQKERIEWVDSEARLAELCDQWSQLDHLAVDTEFIRTDTFYPILGLLQVSDGEQCWLVDPLAIEDMLPFAELLVDRRVVKIFHACSEDLEVLRHSMGVVPKPIIDTQVAAAFVGYGFSLGYAALVGDVLDIQLDKHETRSDWLQRPLTEAQCRYGAEDVYYLVEVYRRLLAQLQQRLPWVQSDMAELLTKAGSEGDNGEYYRRIKGAWQLNAQQLTLLQALAEWREDMAREQNRPRNRVVSDKQLLEVARRQPKDMAGLAACGVKHPGSQRRYGDAILLLVDDISTLDRQYWLKPLPQPLPREAGVWVKQLRAIQNELAEELQLAPEILARKADLEAIIASAYKGAAQLPEHWLGSWREELLAEKMLSALPQLSLS